MKRYPAYKDSEFAGIGEVPIEWRIHKIKKATHFLYGQSLPCETRQKGNIPVYGSNGITGYHDEAITKAPCIVIGRKGSFGKVQFSPNECFPIDTTFYIDATATKNNLRWLFYLLMNLKLDSFSKDSAVPGINREELNENLIPFPDSSEQVAISNYLDHKTHLIDTLIEKKQKLIELLQEQRAAIINQAVTKGLNPNVKMKDSGIEWLGEVSEHWEVKRFKHLLRRQKGAIKTGPFGSQLKGNDFIETGIKVYNQRTVLDNDFNSGVHFISEEKYESLRAFEAFPGDILITTRGTIGRCAIVPEDARIAVLHPCLIRLQVDTKYISNDYLQWFIQDSEIFKENVIFESNATTIEVIYGDTLKNVRLPLPPVGEQEKILTFLNQKTSMMDSVSKKIQQEINALQEYRSTLISEVVTGKIDVRDEVIP